MPAVPISSNNKVLTTSSESRSISLTLSRADNAAVRISQPPVSHPAAIEVAIKALDISVVRKKWAMWINSLICVD